MKTRSRIEGIMAKTMIFCAVAIVLILVSQFIVMLDGGEIIMPYLFATRRLVMALFAVCAAIFLMFVLVYIAYELLIRYLVYKEKQFDKGET